MDRCELVNPVFKAFGPVVFRRAEADGAPSMVLPMGEKLAVLPLRSLRREFGIEEASADGRMLGLIAASLDYVTGLRIGDTLPPEVTGDGASWEPAAQHRQIADARLRAQLLGALDPAAGAATPAQLEADPKLRAAVQTAFERAAQALGLPGPEAVVRALEGLAGELAFIEALREGLLARVQGMCARVQPLGLDWRGNGERQTTLTQVRRLSAIALTQLATRFAEIDAQTGEVMSTLRNIDRQRAFIRDNRDWLHRARRGWEPVLTEWDSAPAWLDEHAWGRLARTYQFLAPRFMPVQEWERSTAPKPNARASLRGPVMEW